VLRLDLLHPASTKRLLDVRLVALAVELEGALAHLAAADEARDHSFVLVPDLGELDPRGRDEFARVRLDPPPLALLLRLRQRAAEHLGALDAVDAPEDLEARWVGIVLSPADAWCDTDELAAVEVRALRVRLALHGSSTSYAGPGAFARCRGI